MKDMHFRIVIGHQDFPHTGSTDRIDVLTCPTCHTIWFYHSDLKQDFRYAICVKCGKLVDVIQLIAQVFELELS